MEEKHVGDRVTRMKFVKYGFVIGEFCPNLCDYDRSQNRVRVFET